ncbi:MAG TPA: hypothetical protein PKC28_12380 [Bdellovibrionales bacterium]|nr:hypothetical protein [Bdellovibrionales bacterium]
MKSINVLAKVALVAFLAAGLTACGKKKNGSSGTTATTPATTTCTVNQYGTYVDQNGNPCTPTANGNGTPQVCPSNGQYQNQYGQWQYCTPGQTIYPQPGNGYPYPQYPQGGSGCEYGLQQYGVPYVPVIIQGQYLCLRYDLLQQYTQGTYYQDYGYEYYYAYPPYSGSQCNTNVSLGYQGNKWYGDVNFCL